MAALKKRYYQKIDEEVYISDSSPLRSMHAWDIEEEFPSYPLHWLRHAAGQIANPA